MTTDVLVENPCDAMMLTLRGHRVEDIAALRDMNTTDVTVPEADVEAVRDLVRAREDARADLMRMRHRLSKLLSRQGRVCSGGQALTAVHDIWLRRQRFDEGGADRHRHSRPPR